MHLKFLGLPDCPDSTSLPSERRTAPSRRGGAARAGCFSLIGTDVPAAMDMLAEAILYHPDHELHGRAISGGFLIAPTRQGTSLIDLQRVSTRPLLLIYGHGGLQRPRAPRRSSSLV